jgi:hypothetical protein
MRAGRSWILGRRRIEASLRAAPLSLWSVTVAVAMLPCSSHAVLAMFPRGLTRRPLSGLAWTSAVEGYCSIVARADLAVSVLLQDSG